MHFIINSFYKAEQLITVIKNQNNTLPYKNLDEEFLLLSIGSSNKTFLQTIKLFIDVDDHIVSDSNALNSDQKLIVKKAYDMLKNIHEEKYNMLTLKSIVPFLSVSNFVKICSTNSAAWGD